MTTHPSLAYDDARRAIDAILAEVARRGKAVVVAVADPHGELIALARMDGAPLSSITIAINKAFTAARARKPTLEIGEGVRHPETGFDIAYYGDARFVGWGGGLPVWHGGQVVGSVAVSGLPQMEDIEVATVGVNLLASPATA
jgi:glc operon protein GlcG